LNYTRLLIQVGMTNSAWLVKRYSFYASMDALILSVINVALNDLSKQFEIKLIYIVRLKKLNY